jgi:hypothetical protein
MLGNQPLPTQAATMFSSSGSVKAEMHKACHAYCITESCITESPLAELPISDLL